LTPRRAVREHRDLGHLRRVRVGLVGVAAAVALLCGLPAVASAQTAVVNSTFDAGVSNGVCDPAPDVCTLRDAIADDRFPNVQVPEGVYGVSRIPGELEIQRDVTITGVGPTLPTIQREDVEFQHRLIHIFSDSEVVLSHVRLTQGAVPTQNGGAVLVDFAGSLTLSDTEVSLNHAEQGGGIWADGDLRVRTSLFVGNVASSIDGQEGRGGGVGLGEGAAIGDFENTTFSDNESNGYGGGLYTERSMTLRSVSIVENFAPPRIVSEPTGRGGGLSQQFSGASVTTATNTLVARNVNGGCGGTINNPIVSTNGLVDEPLPNTTCNAQGPGNLIVPDAVVGPLADNGGLTRTHALLAGSPAIDTGAPCPGSDQRGVARPLGAGCDIGAYEFVPSQPPSGGGQPPPPEDEELPPPVAGKSVNVEPTGTVKVKLPGTNRFVTLTEDEQLPVGTIVDTLKGRVTLTAAGGQTATFSEGVFRITQGKGARPLTVLTLVETLSCPAKKASAAAKGKKKRRLWGDGKGRFQTKGKHSAATVVGTKWLVEDTCTTTLTRVVNGRVSVRDFVKKKTVVVKAGKSYTAKAKKKR
jgi:predicted outer membrane repeat protein